MVLEIILWERADFLLYYSSTGLFFQSILSDLIAMEKSNNITTNTIDRIYYDIVNSLLCSSDTAVPTYKKNFFKFWWDKELNEDKSIASCRMWKVAGKPRSEPVFDSYRKDKSAHKMGIKSRRLSENIEYTNDLHESLIEKQDTAFGKCWRSRFEPNKHFISHVDGIGDVGLIAEHFASHFSRYVLTIQNQVQPD